MRSFLTATVMAGSAVMLSGCAVQPLHWTKPDATQEMFMQDRYACLQQAPNVPLFSSCMGARGYKQDPNGNLFPPPEASPNGLAIASNVLQGMAEGMDPQRAARGHYDRSVASYRNCLAANPSNVTACEGQRQIMEADAKVLAAASIQGSSTNVYVGH